MEAAHEPCQPGELDRLPFRAADITPFDKFPISDYDVDDPGVDFEKWTLTVASAVQKPGDYTLAQIQALPKLRQNTRHVGARCAERHSFAEAQSMEPSPTLRSGACTRGMANAPRAATGVSFSNSRS
jgi:DMSO/TMAO reductase YedYZ molybdopterin-dependent catalytic subunit